MKNINLKAWPELTAFYPSFIRIERASMSMHPLFLDFSGCREISSTGLTVWLLRILNFVQQSPRRREYTTELFDNNLLLSGVRQLSFFKHLNNHLNRNDMFVEETSSEGPFEPLHHISFNNRATISFPIYCLGLNNYKDEERRNACFPFRKFLMETLSSFSKMSNVNICQFIVVLTEMIKNSADHTDNEAFFGLDVVQENKKVAIHFVFGDMGLGIKKNIQTYLATSVLKKKRASHLSFSDAYHFALTQGCTTKPKSENNKGLGMTLIREGSQGANIDISMFDAYSRCLLSAITKITHEELRKFFYPFTKDQTQPFYYYGVVVGEKNEKN